MKKLMVAVFATVFSMCASAQVINEIKSVRVAPQENETQLYFIQTDSFEVQVSPLIYKIVESNPAAYEVVSVGDVQTIFAKADFATPTQYVFEVAKEPELVNDMPLVTMTNGYKFADPDLAWLAVLPGQHIQVSRYIGLTREITVFETVSRSTPLKGEAAEASAPAKSRLPQMIEAVKAKANANATKTLAMVSTDNVESASNPTGQRVITFGRK